MLWYWLWMYVCLSSVVFCVWLPAMCRPDGYFIVCLPLWLHVSVIIATDSLSSFMPWHCRTFHPLLANIVHCPWGCCYPLLFFMRVVTTSNCRTNIFTHTLAKTWNNATCMSLYALMSLYLSGWFYHSSHLEVRDLLDSHTSSLTPFYIEPCPCPIEADRALLVINGLKASCIVQKSFCSKMGLQRNLEVLVLGFAHLCCHDRHRFAIIIVTHQHTIHI